MVADLLHGWGIRLLSMLTCTEVSTCHFFDGFTPGRACLSHKCMLLWAALLHGCQSRGAAQAYLHAPVTRLTLPLLRVCAI